MKLSPHFSLAELTATSTGFQNNPDSIELSNLRVVAFCMEHVRRLLGNKPIIVTSGFRSAIVNAAVGGTASSDHRLAWAIDFKHSRLSGLEAAKMIAESPLQFDQLILERKNTLIHLSFNPRFRRQVLRQPGGAGTAIYQGLE